MATILVVDDDPNMCKLMSAHLKPKGFEVLEARDGNEALALIECERPDIVLLDYMMPGMSGPETCCQIRDTVDYFLPIIMVTAVTDTKNKVHGFDCGVDDYLVKPFDPNELLARVSALLRTKTMHDDLRKATEDNEMLMDDLRRKNEKLATISVTDELTGLHNRRYFNQRLRDEAARASRERAPIACIMMDVDGFKKINDMHGHDVGDTVLKEVAEILRDGSRLSDVVARIGGDEFVLLLPKTDAGSAALVAERFRKRVESHCVMVDDKVLLVTASFGVASSHRQSHNGSPQDLVRNADKALYDAKSVGCNNVCIFMGPSRHAESFSRKLPA